tara:strand:- start:2664 stop:2804 length:141 start_codon:yes stop_codon:yes gene_type:complete
MPKKPVVSVTISKIIIRFLRIILARVSQNPLEKSLNIAFFDGVKGN